MRIDTAVVLTICLICFIIGCDSDVKKPRDLPQEETTKQQEQTSPEKAVEYYTENEVLQARKKFKVEVIEFDAKSEYGVEFPYSDRVRLRITNNSKMVLPYLTILTKRFDREGKMIGSSRAPSIPASNVKPGETLEYEYYPRGHLPGVERIEVEIEHVFDDDSKQFFKELIVKIPKEG